MFDKKKSTTPRGQDTPVIALCLLLPFCLYKKITGCLYMTTYGQA